MVPVDSEILHEAGVKLNSTVTVCAGLRDRAPARRLQKTLQLIRAAARPVGRATGTGRRGPDPWRDRNVPRRARVAGA
jgi:hypothetical protein